MDCTQAPKKDSLAQLIARTVEMMTSHALGKDGIADLVHQLYHCLDHGGVDPFEIMVEGMPPAPVVELAADLECGGYFVIVDGVEFRPTDGAETWATRNEALTAYEQYAGIPTTDEVPKLGKDVESLLKSISEALFRDVPDPGHTSNTPSPHHPSFGGGGDVDPTDKAIVESFGDLATKVDESTYRIVIPDEAYGENGRLRGTDPNRDISELVMTIFGWLESVFMEKRNKVEPSDDLGKKADWWGEPMLHLNRYSMRMSEEEVAIQAAAWGMTRDGLNFVNVPVGRIVSLLIPLNQDASKPND